MSIELEICAYSVADAICALTSGASRVELCAGEPEGGTTVSIGTLEQALTHCPGPVFPMVRPRGGNFVYDSYEVSAMAADVAEIARLGFPGVVFGALTDSAAIDTEVTRRLINVARSAAPDIQITFHRAFDEVVNPVASFELLAELGVDRVLTSGQQPSALAGIDLITELAQRPAPKVMAGGSVRPANVTEFLRNGVTNVHSSASHEPGGGVQASIVETLRDLADTYERQI